MNPTILVVDDDPLVLSSFALAFGEAFKVITCDTPAKGLEVLERGDEVSLIVADERMPMMSGHDFLEKAKEVRPGIKRVLLTAYSDLRALVLAVNRGGISHYLEKPFSIEAVTDLFHDLLEETVPVELEKAVENIAGNVKRLRHDKDLTQVELARCAGIEPRTLQKLEQMDGVPSLTTLYAVAKGLGVPADALLRGRRRSRTHPS
jgi:two-component system NtrC family sensor kinase